jgi:hypothetical protein
MPPNRRPQSRNEQHGAVATWLILFALWGFALAQPVLDLLGRTTAFFVAHEADLGDLLLFALAASLVGPTLLAVAVRLLARLNPAAGRGLEVAVCALLLMLLAAQGLRRLDWGPAWLNVLVALAGGVLGAGALARWRGRTRAAPWLAAAALLFPLLFLVASPARQIAALPDEDDGAADAAPPLRPLTAVLVVLDEFPLVSLLDESEQIDAERYPNFAALAATATWYRNATTVAQSTAYAVPAILSGRLPLERTVQQPLWKDYKSNLFTVIGRRANMHVVETMTRLCPQSLCSGRAHLIPRHTRLTAMLRDASAVYLHQVTPSAWGEHLPVIGESWRDFWAEPDPSASGPSRAWDQDAGAVFDRFLDDLADYPPPALHYVHLMAPHLPWNRLPDGTLYSDRQRAPHGLVHQRWRGTEWEVLQAQQRHLLQVGWVDSLIGRLRAELEDLGRWRDAIVVITSDHGTSFEPGGMRRNLTATNFAQIVNVPLFIKYPEQTAGTIDDSNVETIDIMPTLVAALGAPVPRGPLGFDLAGARRRRSKVVFLSGLQGSTAGSARTFGLERLRERRAPLARQSDTFGTGSWDRAFAFGPASQLIGQPLASLEEADRPPTGPLVQIEDLDALAAVDPTVEQLPVHLRGRIEQDAGTSSLTLAVALNGVVRAITKTYPQGKRWQFSALVPRSALAAGANQVEILRLSGPADAPRLRRLRLRPGKKGAEPATP